MVEPGEGAMNGLLIDLFWTMGVRKMNRKKGLASKFMTWSILEKMRWGKTLHRNLWRSNKVTDVQFSSQKVTPVEFSIGGDYPVHCSLSLEFPTGLQQSTQGLSSKSKAGSFSPVKEATIWARRSHCRCEWSNWLSLSRLLSSDYWSEVSADK